VLFLDELPEFRKNVLEVLRQPLEDGIVTLSRAATSLTYPARLMLAAAMNPCPCGYAGDPTHNCRCDPSRSSATWGGSLARCSTGSTFISRYLPCRARSWRENDQKSRVLRSAPGSKRLGRGSRLGSVSNPASSPMRTWPRATSALLQALGTGRESARTAITRLGLSARAYHRVLKLARTIADLAGAGEIGVPHISEAIQYRSLDRTHRMAAPMVGRH
jgi:magnesium chelatase family protein